jgi:DNA anti-recombination protein RmuC
LLTEFRALEQADQILDDARELQRRMNKFMTHLQAVGSGLANAVGAFNGAVGSWGSRVAPQLTRISQLSGGTVLEDLVPIDESIREVPDARLQVVGRAR